MGEEESGLGMEEVLGMQEGHQVLGMQDADQADQLITIRERERD